MEMSPPPVWNSIELMYEPELVDPRRSAMTMSRAGMRTNQNTTGSTMCEALVWDIPERPSTTHAGFRGGMPHTYMDMNHSASMGGSLGQNTQTPLSRSASTGAFPSRKTKLSKNSRRTLDRNFGAAYAHSDPLERSWMKMPAYLVATRKALQARQPIVPVFARKRNNNPAPKAKKHVKKEEEEENNEHLMRSRVNDLAPPEHFRVTQLHSIGDKKMMGPNSEAQRFNLFNFPNTGNIYNVPYHAAAARSAEEHHQSHVDMKRFHKYKRRVTDWC